ncbi:probable chitinase 10 [Portunus trituberculatus]|uniref:probable chitinase 10 n=1 Tax=Portunus trituberculatus TaxID=210409 RepID=UPI001E1CEF47|nr:probable chitinase 10 [Portunus trituberculatus]
MRSLQRFMVVVGHGVVADSCLPDCTGHSFLDKVADPNNCTNYYVCFGDGIESDHPLPCGEGEYFDDTANQCDVMPSPPCTNKCDGSSGDSLGCTVTCTFTTTGSDLEVVSDIDCSKYYVCFAGSAQGPFTCPADHPYFDGPSKTCGDDPTTCCNKICKPHCPEKDKVVPDPNNCRRFYFCTEDDAVPDEIYGFDCPVGKNFNLQLGECTSDAECVKICNSNSSETTTPPSSTCNESLTCTETGYFPVCPYCDPRYLNCPSAGVEATLNTCPGSLVFHPTQHYCIKPENCSPSVVSAVVP